MARWRLRDEPTAARRASVVSWCSVATERTLCHDQPLKWRNNMKAAINAYAAALDLEQPTLIDQQIVKCREVIASKGWTICEDYIRSDYGVALTRKGVLSLVAAARLNPRPFDCVVMIDTSKLGRTTRVFDVIERFHHSACPCTSFLGTSISAIYRASQISSTA